MKCITYGTSILLMIIVIIVLAILMQVSPTIAGIAAFAGWAGITVWWLWGWFSSCPDGYLFSSIQKPQPSPTMIVEKQ
jgi:hypothetical protein